MPLRHLGGRKGSHIEDSSYFIVSQDIQTQLVESVDVGVYQAGHQETALPIDLLGTGCVTCQRNGPPFDNDRGIGDPFLTIPYVNVLNDSP